jgi:Chaperone of endosialidase
MDQDVPNQMTKSQYEGRLRESAAPGESTSGKPARKMYASPRLTQHGQLPAMTLGASEADGTKTTSDRTLKERLEPVDAHAILAEVATLPLARWSYKGDPARHLGPMAQDFAAAFALGADDRHIFPLDAAGVALAALQGLHRVVEAQAARLERLEGELRALRQAITALHVEDARRWHPSDARDAVTAGAS